MPTIHVDRVSSGVSPPSPGWFVGGRTTPSCLVDEHLTTVDAYATVPFATVAFAMGGGAYEWVEDLRGIEAFAVTAGGHSWPTAGFPFAVTTTDTGAGIGASVGHPTVPIQREPA